MSYVDQSLMPGETVTYRARLSRIEFAPAFFLFIVGGWMMSVGGMYAPWGYVVLFTACATALGAGVRYRNLELAITDKRILAEDGAGGAQWLAVPLNQLETISITQGPFGRIFGYGTITVRGTGGARQVFQRITDPELFRHIARRGSAASF